MQRWRKDGWWICLEIQKIENGGAVLESKSKMYQRLTKETDAWNSKQLESQSAPKSIRRWSGALPEQWRSRASHWVKQADETSTDMPAVRRISGRLWQSWKQNTRGRSNVFKVWCVCTWISYTLTQLLLSYRRSSFTDRASSWNHRWVAPRQEKKGT